MGPFEMVVAIVGIVTVGSIIRAKYSGGRHQGGQTPTGAHGAGAEAERLREEVRNLKERVAVLERLATDSTSALDREFEKLKQIDRN